LGFGSNKKDLKRDFSFLGFCSIEFSESSTTSPDAFQLGATSIVTGLLVINLLTILINILFKFIKHSKYVHILRIKIQFIASYNDNTLNTKKQTRPN
jgi:hypothetical protein